MHGNPSPPEPEPGETAADVTRAAERLNRLWPAVYRELRRLARRHLAAEPPGHTLSATALVHEVYLRLVDQRSVTWEERDAFLGHAARAMRRVLVDHARRHRALRRGGGRARLSLEPTDATSTDARSPLRLAAAERSEELLALDEALERLERVAPRLVRVVEMRFYAGLTEEETAASLGVTARTVGRDWVKARAWLYRALRDTSDGR